MNGVTPSILHPLADEQGADNALARGRSCLPCTAEADTTGQGNAVCVKEFACLTQRNWGGLLRQTLKNRKEM